MKKTLDAADLTASNREEANAILNQMETVVDYNWGNDGLVTVEYTTDDNDAIEKDWLEACASLES